jgi:hypothetical protein
MAVLTTSLAFVFIVLTPIYSGTARATQIITLNHCGVLKIGLGALDKVGQNERYPVRIVASFLGTHLRVIGADALAHSRARRDTHSDRKVEVC